MDEVLKALKDIQSELLELKQSVIEPRLEKQVYDVEEVATLLDCNPRSVYEMISQGALKCVRVGRAIRVPKQFVNDFLNGKVV